MLTPDQFKSSFVEPAIMQFAKEPTSILHACTLIWCLDALASHVAINGSPVDLENNPNQRWKCERNFKNGLVSLNQEGSWQFQVVRDASDALKHAWRVKAKLGAEKSDLLAVEEVDGWLAFYHGPSRAPRWGKQVVAKLGLIFDEKNNRWIDKDNNLFEGPLTNWVPVMGLIVPVLNLLGFSKTLPVAVIGSDWPS